MIDDIETVCANSFRNFHAKGMDYLCLFRSEKLTVKAYFFDGDLSQLPEIVVPHNHRYAFTTMVLSGALSNLRYQEAPAGREVGSAYNRFDYMTPLNGGDGFKYAGETRMLCMPSYACEQFVRGDFYHSLKDEIHTLRIEAVQTVAILHQYADEMPLDQPTQAFVPAIVGEPPASPILTGLYDRMDINHAQKRMAALQELGFGPGTLT